MRRSTDGGRSWTTPVPIAAGKAGSEKVGYSDPSFVLDEQTGTLFAFFVKSYDAGWRQSVEGDGDKRDIIQAVVVESTDNGKTWSEPRNITPEVFTGPGDKARFAASGAGIQVLHGPFAGRLIQQYTILKNSQYQAMSVFSDDHGKTWKHGTPVGAGMDEDKVVELSDGRLMLNSRRSDSGGGRKIAYSKDGGATWSDPVVDQQIPDPHSNASIIRAFPDAEPGDPKANIVLFSNAHSASKRVNGTVHFSSDSGQTYPVSRVFKDGAMQYSTLWALDKPGTYGLLYEGDFSTINYMTIDLGWLGVDENQRA